jgi:uncharacterized membrane protein YdjX (TVP38/TMEM64 family)
MYSRIISGAIAATILAILFVGTSFLVQSEKTLILPFVQMAGLWGMLAFIVGTVLASITFVPIDVLLLTPLGSTIWGPWVTALFLVIGWTIGGTIDMLIGRLLGVQVISRFAPLTWLHEVQEHMPTQQTFWFIVLLQITLPLSVVSYAFGMFSKVSWKRYAAATAVGVIPNGLIFSFIGALPFQVQVGFVALGVAAAATAFVYFYQQGKKGKRRKTA